ncbi:ATP-dependent DNA helicase PIF1-like [Beta vulgaris subsp. vulgaris]|uniref:ATP-dependent DNA helicase PIF1-like n=1 Tax=Beta vulgaris subsp. vulgaris TaxID=3555 RepID=UPI00053FEE3B|nr:ATP-dependent DNA helicase PIF1-like [Beta vulgaris subsp. vulgaris]
MGNHLPFGGKIIVFGGDFRQVLPVVRNGTRALMIDASFVKSPIWRHVNILHLRENMRSRDDSAFATRLLSIGNGDEPTVSDQMIKLPNHMVIPSIDDVSIEMLIDRYEKFVPARVFEFNSASGLPPHALTLKPGVPLTLVRNIDPKNGLCNGTRLLCRSLNNHFIDAEILTGHSRENRVFLPRIPLKSAEDIKLPFELVRKQFPVKDGVRLSTIYAFISLWGSTI